MSLELSARFVKQDFCRLCLSSIYELQALFPKGPSECSGLLMSKISLLAEIILIPTEEMNSKICSRCIQQLDEFDSFKRRCKDSDFQIRKIRELQKWNDRKPSPASGNVGPENQEKTKFGGIFDLMMYTEHSSAELREYYMLFDESVYRKETLLVWRCELTNCPCQLLVENDFSKFSVHGAHNHVKLSNDLRKFVYIDQRICAFLNQLRNQMDGVIDNIQIKNVPQTIASNSQMIEIQYIMEGDKPAILVNTNMYYKETVNSDIIPSQIYWRCKDKNCLGMIITTADLRSYKLCKDHNHTFKAVTNRCSAQMDLSVKVASLPMKHIQPSATTQFQSSTAAAISLNSTNVNFASTSKLPDKQNMNAVENQSKQIKPNESTLCATPVTSPSDHTSLTFFKDLRNYYVYISLVLYRRDIRYSSPTNAEIVWKCMGKECPGTVIVYQNLKFAAAMAHNHGPIDFKTQILTRVPSAEALFKPIIVPEISFYNCSTSDAIYLIYKQFIYSVLSFFPTTIAWKCGNIGCDAQLRSGMAFEFLTTVKNHNHGPVLQLTVDVESYLTVEDALRKLTAKSKDQVKVYCPQQQKRNQKVRKENVLKQRRKSTWC